MKRFPIILFVLLMVFADACGCSAEGLSYIPCTCGQDPCVCFLQTLDQGPIIGAIIKYLRVQGYVKEDRITQFTREILDATLQFQADHDLPLTGTWDDTSLTLLIWGMTPKELDETMPPLAGKEETYPDMCYVPSDGGHKRHSDPDCSEMYDPRKVSIRNAAALGFDACSKCEGAYERRLAAKYPRPQEEEEKEAPPPDRSAVLTFAADAVNNERSDEITYIVNKNSKKFHLPDCSGAQNIKEKNRMEVTCTREELLDQGYQPCGICNP